MILRCLLLIFIGLVIPGRVNSQEDWTLQKDKNGIKVFTRKVENLKFHELKVECEFHGRLSQLAAVLLDVNNHTRWVYQAVKTELLEASGTNLFFYTELECPWPFDNRDLVAHMSISQNQENKVMTVNAENVDGYLPVNEDIVRVKFSRVRWIVTPSTENHLKVDYRIQMDPGGSLPAWLLNLFISKGPFESFSKLKEEIELPQYALAKFPFIVD